MSYYIILLSVRSPYRPPPRVISPESISNFYEQFFRVIIYDVPAGFNRILYYIRVVCVCYYYYNVSISPTRAYYIYIIIYVHAFKIYMSVFFFAVVIFRPAQLLSETSFSYRSRFTMMELYLFYFFFFHLFIIFRSFVYRCYCGDVRCVSVCIKKS